MRNAATAATLILISACSQVDPIPDEEKAEIEMWLRRIELDAFIPLLHAVRNAGRPGTVR